MKSDFLVKLLYRSSTVCWTSTAVHEPRRGHLDYHITRASYKIVECGHGSAVEHSFHYRAPRQRSKNCFFSYFKRDFQRVL